MNITAPVSQPLRPCIAKTMDLGNVMFISPPPESYNVLCYMPVRVAFRERSEVRLTRRFERLIEEALKQP